MEVVHLCGIITAREPLFCLRNSLGAYTAKGDQMTTLTLRSPTNAPLKPIVEAAIDAERRLVEVAIRQTERRLAAFEQEHRMTTAEFLRRYANDELAETLELDEWIGESRLLTRLREKEATLRGIEIGD